MCRLRLIGFIAWAATSLIFAQTTDPVKIAALQQRFQQGLSLEEHGKVEEALTIYESILTDEPKARASLLHAGIICQHLAQLEKANKYLSHLHELEPKYPAALEALIQINQSLRHSPRVVVLLKEFKDLHESGDVPAFTASLYFVRERVPLPTGGQAVFCEFFNYQQDPNTVWMMQKFDPQGNLLNWILLNYDPEDTAKVQQKDPVKLGNVQVFLLQADVIKANRIKSIDVYQQLFSLPTYEKVRTAMLDLLDTPPIPIHSEPSDLPLPDFDKDANPELNAAGTGRSPAAQVPPPAPVPGQ